MRRRLAGVLQSVIPADRADELTILSGAGLNVAGLVIAVLATFGSQVLLAQALGSRGYGVVYVATQVAFVGAAFTRFGMDMAAVREVAIAAGAGEPARARAIVDRAATIAGVASLVVAAGVWVLADALTSSAIAADAFRAAAIGLPFVALAQVYLGGTRGLKTMTPTLLVYWAGQPLAWIVLILAGFWLHRSADIGAAAYSGSWIFATAAAYFAWCRRTDGLGRAPLPQGETVRLLRFGAPRAPAALFAQLLFVLDVFVLKAYDEAGVETGVYAAASRVSLLVVVFLTSVALVFSPFVADLYARGEKERLGRLFQLLTRSTFALTLPVILVLLVMPEPVLRLFGGDFSTPRAQTGLLILLAGQTVNVLVGSVGFVMVMVGRTGWDALVYTASIAVDLLLCLWLIPGHGLIGAAVAQAVTLAASNALRVWLVWRFVGVQPFNRHYLRLAVPAAAGAGAMAAVHAWLSGFAPWGLDLSVSAGVGVVVYAVVLVAVGLAPAERAAVRRALAGLRGRAEG